MKQHIASTIAGAAALVVVGASVHSAKPETVERRSDPGTETLVLVAHAVGIQPVGVPPKDLYAGDFNWFDGRLYNRDHTETIGRYIIRCEETRIATVACEGTFKVRGRGKLFTRYGQVGPNDPRVEAIVGGTGDFASAAGQGVISDVFPDHTWDQQHEFTLTH
jgi:hypothetical protein